MLHDLKQLESCALVAQDGKIGHVRECYFSDDSWLIRYLVVDTGGWLTGRLVLISPNAVQRVSDDEIQLNLTRKQVEESPPIESHQPISRRYELEYHNYYGYPFYWGGTASLWGTGVPPLVPPVVQPVQPEPPADERDPHLRSSADVTGYHIEATDGSIGHVDDFIVDDERWQIRYLIVDTRNWWPGRHVIVPTDWVERINWEQETILVDVRRDQIKNAPEYSRGQRLGADYERNLEEHYKRQTFRRL
jgi:uncharacterized protein YrrD